MEMLEEFLKVKFKVILKRALLINNSISFTKCLNFVKEFSM